MLRDVMVDRSDHREFVALSTEAGVKGEVLMIHFAKDGNAPVPVRVVDSRPTMVEGSVRHQLRLMTVEDAVTPLDRTRTGCQEAE